MPFAFRSIESTADAKAQMTAYCQAVGNEGTLGEPEDGLDMEVDAQF